MARILEVQSTFSSGEADPRLAERRDVQFYYSAVSRGRNIAALAQGGFSSVPGMVKESQLRHTAIEIGFGGASFSAPNGGTAANVNDGDATTLLTTGAAGAGQFVALQIDLGSARTFIAVDVLGFFSGTSNADQVFSVQVSADTISWADITGPVDIEATAAHARSRRFAFPPGQSATLRYIRIVSIDAAGIGTINFHTVKLIGEGTYTGVVRLPNFNFRAGQEYTIALSPLHGDVFKDGVWQAAFAHALDATMLAQMDWAHTLDSLVLFHEDLETPLIKRQGRDTEWNFAPYPYINLPRYDYGAVYVNGVDAVQRVQLFNLVAGESFDLTIEGQTTVAINVDAAMATTAANIAAALEALPNVAAGLTVTPYTVSLFDVQFTGAGNAGREWLEMAGSAHDTDGVVLVRELVKGVVPGEPVISAARGWPATGAFYNQSLVVGGLKSLPRHILKSVTGAPDDFDTTITTAIGAMIFELDGRTANEILRIHAGPTLIVMTAEDMFFLENQLGLTKTETPRFKPAEQPGLKRGVPLASLEGGLIYVEASGTIIREALYSEVLQNFQAKNISVLSAHLLDDPIDLTHRRAVRSEENDLIHLVNSDGTLLLMTALRSENITGFTMRQSVNGQFKAVSCTQEQIVRAAIARTTAGVTRLWLERFDRSAVTEAATIATGVGITSVSPGTAFNGELLHVFCDDGYIGTRTVAAGAIAGLPASARIEAGIGCLADVRDMPVLKDEEAQRPLARLKRVVTLHVSLFETDHLAVAVNDGPVYEVPLLQMGEAEIGDGALTHPFTGTVHLEGFLGFTEGGHVWLGQTRPGRLNVRSVRKEVRV